MSRLYKGITCHDGDGGGYGCCDSGGGGGLVLMVEVQKLELHCKRESQQHQLLLLLVASVWSRLRSEQLIIWILSKDYNLAKQLGDSIIEPVPSLFTLKTDDIQLTELDYIPKSQGKYKT